MRPVFTARHAAALNALARHDPAAAGRRAFRWFCTPNARPFAPADDVFLGEARRWTIPHRRVRLAGYTWPGGAGAVLLVHGWESNSGRWKALAPALRAAGFAVSALDAPAHGASPRRTLHPLEYADVIAQAAHAVGPLRAIIAHSIGSMATTLALAEHPELAVERVILACPPASTADFATKWLSGWKLSAAVGRALRTEARRQVGRPLEQVAADRAARSIRRPALVIHDEGDEAVPLSHGERVARAWPGARFRRTTGLGHRRIFDDEAVRREVLAFLRG